MTLTFKKTTLISAIFAASLGLAACGGGSSDEQTTASGAAGTTAKGIINMGSVQAYELDLNAADPFAAPTLVGEAQTDISGAYSLDLNGDYNGGPILLTLTTSATSQMKCDTASGCGARTDTVIADTDTNVDFGEWYLPGANAITMQALIPSGSSGTVAAGITPFTNMAVARAKNAVTFDNDAIINANSEVANLLNIKADTLLSTQPVDITDPDSVSGAESAEQVAYAAYSAAIANIAANNGQTLEEAIDALASSFADGEMDIDEVSADPNSISVREIVAGAQATLEEAEVTDNSGAIEEMNDEANAAEEAGQTTVNPEPTDAATADAITQAKAFIADFRTYAGNMQMTLENPSLGANFASEVETAAAISQNFEDSDTPIGALGYALELLFSADKVFTFEGEANGDYSANETITFTEEDDFPFTGGSVTINASGNYTADGDDGSVDGTYNENEEENYSGTLTFNNVTFGSQTINMTLAFENGQYIWGYNENATGYVENETDNVDLVADGSIVGTSGSEIAFNDTTIKTQWSYDYTQAGDVGTYNETYGEELDVDFTATLIVPTSDTTSVTFEGNIVAAGLATNTYSDSWNSNTGDYSYSSDSEGYIKTLQLNGTVSAGEESMGINLTLNMPNADDFYNNDTAETASNYLQIGAGLGFNVDLAMLSDVDVQLSASRTGLNTANATVTLSQGDNSIVMSADGTYENEGRDIAAFFTNVTGDITISNNNGVEMVITPPTEGSAETTLAVVAVNGTEVGVVEENANGMVVINYANGDFETF